MMRFSQHGNGNHREEEKDLTEASHVRRKPRISVAEAAAKAVATAVPMKAEKQGNVQRPTTPSYVAASPWAPPFPNAQAISHKTLQEKRGQEKHKTHKNIRKVQPLPPQ